MYIITTDTHLGRSNSNQPEIDITLNCFKWIVETAKKNSIKKLIHLGDFFDTRKYLYLPTIKASIEIIKEELKYFDEIYLIVGNHDIYYKNQIDPTSLEIFNSYENITLVKTPQKIDNIILIPWMINSDYNTDIINNVYNVDYIMGHFSMNGISMNWANVVSQNENLNISDFKRYKKVLSGHYHKRGNYSNVEYIGAPYHMSFNDDGERGVYILKKDEFRFVQYTNYPKYCIFNSNNIDYDIIEGNNIRLDFYENVGINKINNIVKKVENQMPNSLSISYKFKNEFTIDSNIDIINDEMDNEKILIDYIKTLNNKNISINILTQIIRSMVN